MERFEGGAMRKENKNLERLNIKDWEIRSGVKILKPTGFWGKNSEKWNKLYTQREFRRNAKSSYISIKTEKGLAFLNAR